MSLYKDASLVMIPSAYKDGKLYSIRPTDGSGDFTFSRGSNLAATRVDVNGLIEKGRENVLTYSNDFSQWIKSNTTETSGQSGYDGSSDAWLLTKSNSNAFIRKSISSSGVNTFSIFAKAGTLSWVRLLVTANTNATAYADLSNGNIGTISSGTIDANTEDLGNGWYRIFLSINDSSIDQVRIYPADGDDDTSGTSGSIYIQDAQLEQGLVATDYIETGTSAAQSGILEDMPRLDYSGSCPALLLEPQRTNKNSYSEYFLHSQAVYTNASGTANAAISPEGVQNAHKLLEDTANARHRFYITGASAGAGNIVVSAFLKDGNRGYGALHLDTGTDGRYTIIVDLSDGSIVDTMTFGTPDVVDEGVEPYGDGWYRAYIVLNKTSSANVYPQIGLASSDSDANSSGMPSYQGDGTHYIYCYGVQLEVGSYPTSYIPTYGTSQTRSNDSCANTSATDIINQEQGTLFVDFVFNGKQDNIDYYHFAIIDSYAQNEIRLGGYNLALYGRVYSGGTLTFAENYTASATIGQRYKVIIKYGSEGVKTFANGQLKDSGTPTLPTGTMDEIRITRSGVGTHSSINQSVYFPTALTDSECIALTSI